LAIETYALNLSHVATRRSVLVLLNAKAGTQGAGQAGLSPEAIRDAFGKAGIEAMVFAVAGAELNETAKRGVQQYDAVVAGGGDGTLSSVASALTGTTTPLGILPLGTLNHFAKDLAIPLELGPAVETIANGVVREVDVAQVNDRIFVNNSSIGLYPRVVTGRDRQMERLGRGKWSALARAILAVFRRVPVLRIRMAVNGETHVQTTPAVFVGNNQYQIDLLNLGKRATLDEGVLCCYFTTRTGRFALLRLAIRTILGRLSQSKDFHAMCSQELWIDSVRPTLKVAVDGEVTNLPTPLHYVIQPKALRVIVPGVEK
jgi:diacylglycerol kinase family enzyme